MIVALVATTYLATRQDYVSTLYEFWSSPGELYAPVLVLVAGYMLVSSRNEVEQYGAPSIFAALGLAGIVSSLWFVSDVTNLLAGQHVTTFFAAVAILVCQFGVRGALAAFTPLGLFILSLPLWGSLTPALQSIAASSADWIVTTLGVIAHRDGYLIEVPNGTFRVDPGCSGLSYLTAAVALGLAQGHLVAYSLTARVALVALCALLAVVGNAIRIASVILFGAIYGMDQPIVKDHLLLGWIIFGLLTVPIVLLPNRKGVRERYGDTAPTKQSNDFKLLIGGATVAITLAASPLAKMLLERSSATIELPIATNTLHPEDRVDDWKPGIVGADVQAMYRSNGHPDVLVHAYGFTNQRQGKELVNELTPVIATRWTTDHVQRINAGGLALNSAVVERRGHRTEPRLVWYVYIVGGLPTPSRATAKLLEVVNAFNHKGAWLIAMDAQLNEQAKLAMEAVASEVFGAIQQPAALPER